MKYRTSILVGVFTAFFLCLATGQTAPATPPRPQPDPELTALVQKQFGPTFTLPAGFPTPLITADFDGDGVPDVAIVADSPEPLPDSVAYKYRVFDPYNSYFGMGDPAVTTTFRAPDPRRDHVIVIIFGAGNDGWHASEPKAKSVIVNLPFDTISVGRMLIKKNKPPIFVIKARETEVMDSAVFWDAKKKRWRWEPGGPPRG